MTITVWIHSFCPEHTFPTENITSALERAGIQIDTCPSSTIAGYGIILLTQITGEVCDMVRTIGGRERTRILALVAAGDALPKDGAWQLLHSGASDVLVWDRLQQPGPVIAARLKRWREVDAIVQSPLVQNNLVGESRVWTSVVGHLVEAARFTDAPILLVGETGTGKELASRLIHSLDKQRNKHELIILDCTTIVPELSGSELFGHERGAFTGAMAARDGAFALADRGTLFLDEVGELSPALQVQLLRVLQEGTYKRVGSNTWHKSDFRLLCATNRDLHEEQLFGKFRRDLYYRVASWTIRLPGLRERVDDIIPLVRYFLRQAIATGDLPELDEAVRAFFLTRDYPGNVRDLQSLVARIATRHVGPGPITIGDIPADERPEFPSAVAAWEDHHLEQTVRRAMAAGLGMRDICSAVEEVVLRVALEDEEGNLKRAAQRLDVSLRTLQNRRAQYREHEQAVFTNGKVHYAYEPKV